jgi:hypothetical protein
MIKKFFAIADPVMMEYNSFKIVKPREWKEVVNPNNIIIYLPKGSSIDDPLSEKFGIMVAFLPENNTLSLKDLTRMDIEESIKASGNIEFSGKYDDARLGEIDGLRIVFITRIKNKDVEATQVRAIHGNIFYAFTHQCLKGECKHSKVFEEMIQSFEWKNPE